MKKYLLTSVFVFFACVIALNAQENQEKKKVHLKIIKEENDKITEIDTVFEGTDKEGLHYFGDIDGKDINIDSILKEFKIEGHEGMKFMTISDKYHSKDSLKHVWHTINADVEGDPVKMKKMIFISEDGDKKLIESKEGMVFVHSDCDSDDEHVFIHGDGKKVKIIKKEIGDSMVWISEEEGVHKITDDGNVFIYKTGDKTFDIIKSEDGENQIIKEFIVKKNGEIEKTIEIMVTEDGDYSIVKIIGDDDDLMHAEENVKIYKYKTDDGKITVKAEITDSEKGEKKKLKKNLRR
ncbi:MAG: hypothetical protein PF485_13150 [Bacteroidales bacterium]|jgi:hypothetical protein|nr:hypothetical protein [Bacteroidales bacterium]